MKYFRVRKVNKSGKDVLHHARHIRHMREDLMEEGTLSDILQAEELLSAALKTDDISLIESSTAKLYDKLAVLTPQKKTLAGFRENFEVIVVALAVAMSIKAYFLQPFKIPTGSMQPTLYGVTVDDNGYKPTFMDTTPLKYFKWIITGDMYKKVVVKQDGSFSGWFDTRRSTENLDPVYKFCRVGNKKYKVPESAAVDLKTTGFVKKGTVLWEGVMSAGDHVFVDKVSWNFRRPHRGEIIVFKTDGIRGITRGAHYIKRLVGMPGERIRIQPPSIEINGSLLNEPRQIARIQNKVDGHTYGYRIGGFMSSSDLVALIPDDGYFAFGDNTISSQDSRYWGHVPQQNMMGPALWVYWPFTARWGYANK